MFDFHLQFPVSPLPVKLNYHSRVLMFGSCFASGIGELMQRDKFSVTLNPHGIIYDPISICASISDVIGNRKYTEKDIFHHQGLWKSFSHHGSFSHPDKNACLEEINQRINDAHEALKKAKWLVITFGSAFYYRYLPTPFQLPGARRAVANCHKLPSGDFSKEMITPGQLEEETERLFSQLEQSNPDVRVLFTVSPVRYVRDGVVENNLSKAVLLQGVHELVKRHERAFYFPAYELVIDDLRDYRFYKPDLVHPNELALAYVWEKFREAALDEEAKALYASVAQIIQAKNHRLLHPGSVGSREFFMSQLKKCESLAAKKGAPDLSGEAAYFRKQLSKV